MATHNLIAGQGVEESFSIALRGKDGTELEYSIKYPNTEEMREILKQADDLEELIKSKATPAQIKKKSAESEKALNDLIAPVGHEIKFADVFAVQSVNVQRKFRQVIAQEFSS